MRDQLNRREMLVGLSAIIGTALTADQLSSAWATASKKTSQAILNNDLQNTLSSVCDMVIPATETGGAIAAKVPEFISVMINEWASSERKEKLLSAITFLHAQDIGPHNDKSFSLLEAIDAAAYANDNSLKSYVAANYRELKNLIVFGYYSSEIGASEELIYEGIPGPFEGDIPFSDIGKTWAT